MAEPVEKMVMVRGFMQVAARSQKCVIFQGFLARQSQGRVFSQSEHLCLMRLLCTALTSSELPRTVGTDVFVVCFEVFASECEISLGLRGIDGPCLLTVTFCMQSAAEK